MRLVATARQRKEIDPLFWPVLLIASVGLLNVFSVPGSVRGYTVRYVIPASLALPFVLAAFVRRLGRSSFVLATAAALLVIVFDISGYCIAGCGKRRDWEQAAVEEDAAIAFLERERVEVVIGDYWTVYPIDYLSGERVHGLAVSWDLVNLDRNLDERQRRIALVSPVPGKVGRWAEALHWPGRTQAFGPMLEIFLPDAIPPMPTGPVGILPAVASAQPRD